MSRKEVIQIIWLTAQHIIYLLQDSFLPNDKEDQMKVCFGVKSVKSVSKHSFTTLMCRQELFMQKGALRLNMSVLLVHVRENE